MNPVIQGSDAPFDVVIVGGGASGVLVAIHLLRGEGRALRIAIVEPRGQLAQGVAYSTRYPEHLLNVVASKMSAIDGDPGHFVRFLAQRQGADADAAVLGPQFARRMDFGAYLRETLDGLPGAADIEWIREPATTLENDAGWVIGLASGRQLAARSVVLAIGNEARALPLPASAQAGAPDVIDAWDYQAVRGFDGDDSVCIIGSGLSMVDAVASMAANGHRGPVTVLSRHGLLPLAHARLGARRDGIALDALLAAGMRGRLRLIRGFARADLAHGEPWQWTMDALRHHGQALWQQADVAERSRFLRHVARHWDIHRHRIAPGVAAMLDGLRASGQLRVRAGRLLSIARKDDGAVVRYRGRGAAGEDAIAVDRIVNATGIETSFARNRRPLVRALHAQGLLQPGPMGLGVATDADGALVGASGVVSPDLMTLGAPRIGELWESIAVPELRVQAERIATVLRARHP